MNAWENAIVGEGEEAPDQLLANPENFRRHPKEQLEALEAVLEEIGWIQRVIVNRSTGHMIDGHARVELAIRRDEATVPVLYVDLDERKERIALASLDPLSGLAFHDDEALRNLIDHIGETQNADLDDFLADLRPADDVEAPEGHGDDERVPDTPKDEPITQDGDVWMLGGHRLICGDAHDPSVVAEVMNGRKIDSLVTDPPYGVAYQGEGHEAIENDTGHDYGTWYAAWLEATKPHLAEYNTFFIFNASTEIASLINAIHATSGKLAMTRVWVKNSVVLGRGDYNAQHELIAYGWYGKHRFYGGFPSSVIDDVPDEPEQLKKAELAEIIQAIRDAIPGSVVRWDKPRKCDLHPTMKPPGLMELMVRDGSPPGGNILDSYAGSGSTFLASERAGRKCHGIELTRAYCDVICQRWHEWSGQEVYRESDQAAWTELVAERDGATA